MVPFLSVSKYKYLLYKKTAYKNLHAVCNTFEEHSAWHSLRWIFSKTTPKEIMILHKLHIECYTRQAPRSPDWQEETFAMHTCGYRYILLSQIISMFKFSHICCRFLDVFQSFLPANLFIYLPSQESSTLVSCPYIFSQTQKMSRPSFLSPQPTNKVVPPGYWGWAEPKNKQSTFLYPCIRVWFRITGVTQEAVV